MEPTDPSRKHTAVIYFDASYSNPNGDPDTEGAPRIDPSTREGLVTDGSTKRKLRDVVLHKEEGESPFDIFVHPERALTTSVEQAMEEAETVTASTISDQCIERFWDVRLFGAALSTVKIESVQGAHVLGPVQIGMGRSVDPVEIMEQSITRVTPTKEGESRTMGRKHVVPYGLYRQTVNYNPNAKTADSVTEEDLELFWSSFNEAWELTRSSARPEMAFRGACVFTHESALGSAPSHELLGRVSAETDAENPRAFSDYDVSVNTEGLPDGVELTRL
jgi:CRISPR-associated protein Cas7/Csd2, subtype I-C/DVULG